MASDHITHQLDAILEPLRVRVRFGELAIRELTDYPKDIQKHILALILYRAKAGPLLKPHGLGEPLHGKLIGFTKIKSKSLSLRIIYRPRKIDELIHMEIIAIGPREREEVYRDATKRVLRFRREMQE